MRSEVNLLKRGSSLSEEIKSGKKLRLRPSKSVNEYKYIINILTRQRKNQNSE
jgi:hypothetical protein